jgi:hypothetical protein
MKTVIAAAVAVSLVVGLFFCSPGRAADDAGPAAVVDKAIKALGGAEALAKVKAIEWTSKGTITINGADNPITLKTTIRGVDHARREFEGDFDGTIIKGVTVVTGDKAWRRFMDEVTELDGETLANERRATYLSWVPLTLLPLKDKGFKLEAIADATVNDKPAAGLKVTPADGKDFQLYFDKASGLPVRMVAKVLDYQGNEYTQETAFGEYKAADGIRHPTKITSKRDGEKYVDVQVGEFKTLDKVDAAAFEQPK